jgi:hypothetical protein
MKKNVLEMIEESRKTRERIGSRSEEVMGWVLHFIQTPLESLSVGDFYNLAQEIQLFVNGGVHAGHFTLGHTSRCISQTGMLLMEREEARDLQRFASSHVQALIDQDYTTFSFGNFRLMAMRGPDKGVLAPMIGTIKEGFAYFLAHTIADNAKRLGKCPECQQLFVSVRLHQKFCSPQCRSRVGTREFRKAHSNKSKPKTSPSNSKRVATKATR